MNSLELSVRRTGMFLRPDCSRVLLRPFFPASLERAERIVRRVVNLGEDEAAALLEQVMGEFSGRHARMEVFLQRRHAQLERILSLNLSLSSAKRFLVAAYFTQEYSLESAALFNPSIMPHPDQSSLSPGALRFILSLRATGEGHISSLTFRSGVIDADGGVRCDVPARFVSEPAVIPNSSYNKELFGRKLSEVGLDNELSRGILLCLPDFFSMRELEDRLSMAFEETAGAAPSENEHILRGIRMLAQSNFEVEFEAGGDLSERAIFPVSPSQINGIEDARFVCFDDDDGKRYYATYTAFDGKMALSQMLETHDFLHFKFNTLNGMAVQNKGMALFPKKINGCHAMLSRQDNENIFLMFSDNIHFWHSAEVILRPKHSWEFVQLGNCGSPIETEHGWLVLIHGVGPMRKYCLGAFLLDLHDPRKVIGRLREPLLKPDASEREGYVPNVVYTCGALVHRGLLIIPYATSDQASTFASIPLENIFEAMES
ncbi:MAG: glycoside hydrolase family 130 protein [Verrucomicrobiae bacterium]|nr:glycoside hydrolase family 130 protein [Verrucomicrobiae bacterium]